VKVGTQIWALITVVVVIALVAGGYFLGVAPLLQQQASADADRRAARAVNDGLEAEIAQLQLAKSDVDEYQSLASDYEELIPGKVDSQRFIRGLDALAAANGVTISELKIDEFIPYSAPVADDQFDEKAPPPYTNDRITDKNFVIVPFSLTVDGGWAESLNFVHLLQFGDRLVLLTGIDQSTTDTAYSTKISGFMYVFVKPGALVKNEQVDQGGTAPTEPSDGETPSARG